MILRFAIILRAFPHKMKMKFDKKGKLLYQVIAHLVLIGIVFGVFTFAVAGQVNSRDVKQQVLENQLALLIESAEPGMVFSVSKENPNGVVNDLRISEGRIFVEVDNFISVEGKSFFTRYEVFLEEDENKFYIYVR